MPSQPRVHNAAARTSKDRHRRYQQTRTDTEYQAFYQSERWRRFRKWFLARNPLCVDCLEEGRTEPSTVADHTEEVKDNWERRLDEDNVMARCQRHHNRKTAKTRRGAPTPGRSDL